MENKQLVNVSKHFIEERETDQDILEDMLHEYNLPDVTNILMREEEYNNDYV